MLVVALLGCALHTSRAGLVQPFDVEPLAGGAAAADSSTVPKPAPVQKKSGPVVLRTYDGRTYRLHLDDDSAAVRYLGTAIVKVEGPRFGRGLWVKDWYVEDAGDGSGGFVGVLRTYGSRLLVDDRNTQRSLVIADGTAPELRSLVGKTVLIRGHVVGGETIAVAAYRVLGP